MSQRRRGIVRIYWHTIPCSDDKLKSDVTYLRHVSSIRHEVYTQMEGRQVELRDLYQSKSVTVMLLHLLLQALVWVDCLRK